MKKATTNSTRGNSKATPEERLRSRPRNPESGYTLLIALLLVATILLITAAAAPNIYVEGRRDRDEEMIWRGQQYVRAIGLYYKKYGRYPHTIDDLTKSDNQIRFLRQAYKDPMNKDDGSWRLIYVGPGGVLINSVMYTNIAQVGLGAGAIAPPGSVPNMGGTPVGDATSYSAGAAAGANAPAPSASAGQGAGANANSDSDSDQMQGDVVGGNLVGVGSKVKKPSIKVYKGGTTYYQWEFIWNPLQGQQTGAGATPATATTPGTGTGAATGAGSTTGTPPAGSTSPTNVMPGGAQSSPDMQPPGAPGQ